MTGLSSALSSALSGLLVTSSQSALVSRNVTRANDADYSRRDVGLTVAADGTARLGQYTRSADKGLQDRLLKTSSQFGGAQITFEAMSTLSSIVGDPADNTSIAAGLYELQQSLREFQNNPSSNIYAAATISDARSLASRLKLAADDIVTVRNEAHAGVKSSVENINSLLTELRPIEQAIRSGISGTEGYLDNLDNRDRILKQLSEEIGLRVVNKSDGSIALYTDSGITLFDVVPRKVEVKSEGPLVAGMPGPMIVIDGVQVSGGNTSMSVTSGKLAALLTVRDQTALTYEAQLDETARSLISMFAEHDQSSAPALPPATGLFKYGGSPAIPAAGTHMPGLARQIELNPLFDDRVGGNPQFLRDGGSNGSVYLYNSSNQVGFQQHLADLADAFDAPFNFDVVAELGGQSSIKVFAEASASRLASERQRSSAALDEAKSINQHWVEASLSKTGVNLDEEMAALLSLEKSYQASAKVMTTVDQMFAVLVGIVR